MVRTKKSIIQKPPDHLHNAVFFNCGNGLYGVRCSFCDLYLGEFKMWIPDRNLEFCTTILGKKYPKGNNAVFDDDVLERFS